MDQAFSGIGALDDEIAAMARASSPSEIFRAFLEGSRHGAPRAAIFLVRQGGLRGWGSRGYPTQAADRLRGLSLKKDETWLGRALESSTTEIFSREAGEDFPNIGQPASSEALALPVRVAGKAVAVLMAERGPGDPPCFKGVLRLLVTVSRLKLELDLTWRKLRGKPAVASSPKKTPPIPPDLPLVAPTSPAKGEPPQEASLTPIEESRKAPEDTRRREARRFARLVATEIRLYNEEAVMLGRRNRDLVHRLGDQLDRGEETFGRRFTDLGDEGLGMLRDAYIQVLAAGDPSLLSRPGPS